MKKLEIEQLLARVRVAVYRLSIGFTEPKETNVVYFQYRMAMRLLTIVSSLVSGDARFVDVAASLTKIASEFSEYRIVVRK